MAKSVLFATLFLAVMAIPVMAQDHVEEEEHEVTSGDLTIVHPWARAAISGGETLVFLEILNAGEPVQLIGAETEIAATAELVGAAMGADGQMNYQPVGPVQVASGDFDLDPDGLAILLKGLTRDLVQGEDFEIEVEFGDGEHVHLHVAIEAADARQHSHAGHSH